MSKRVFAKKLLVHRTSHPIVQMMRYGMVVMVAAPIDLGGYILLLHLGWEPVLAATISFSVSLIVNYFMSRVWVFNADDSRKKSISASLFFLIGLIGLALTDLIVWIAISKMDLNEIVAKLIAFSIVFFWSFNARRYVFKPRQIDTQSLTN